MLAVHRRQRRKCKRRWRGDMMRSRRKRKESLRSSPSSKMWSDNLRKVAMQSAFWARRWGKAAFLIPDVTVFAGTRCSLRH